ncbi:MAG: VOC family protein [Candidatus Zixiibacteriota bacterium]
MKNRIDGICDHIGIFTDNCKRLVDFYIKKLGFKKEKEEILSESLMKSVFQITSDCKLLRLVLGSTKIEIFCPKSVRLKRIKGGVGYNHWGLCVEDSEKFCKRIKRKKVRVTEVKRNGHSVYFVHDPDGNRIEIRDCSKSVTESQMRG